LYTWSHQTAIASVAESNDDLNVRQPNLVNIARSTNRPWRIRPCSRTSIRLARVVVESTNLESFNLR
ncbi:hypothetical protein N9D38_12575, partial [Rubripirellula sp.]|nr:hypothetical protein [Rubripirellula sp.]